MSDTVLYMFSVFLRLSALMGFFASDIPPCGKIKVVVVLIIATKYLQPRRLFSAVCKGMHNRLSDSSCFKWLIHVTPL